MMGGLTEYFTADKRNDKKVVFKLYEQKGYKVIRDRKGLQALSAAHKSPTLGVFYENSLPYSLDRANDSNLREQVPTLAEMTTQAISILSKNSNGFVLQVEAGKVDWAAHANDTGALLYDQIAFDDAIKVAMEFAERDNDTLVIVTTDHGNANPGLFYGSKANANFESIHEFKHTNEWILAGVDKNFSAASFIEKIKEAQGIVIKKEEALSILKHYETLDEEGLYNPKKLPFKHLASVQTDYTSIGWGSMTHSGDYVELAMFGPGSELLKPFVKNTELHNLMLEAAGVLKA